MVTTLHTVLASPAPVQRRVMDQINTISSKIVVMSEKARKFLRTIYDVPDEKIELIAHGIPDFPSVDMQRAKAKFGFADRSVILTFGLLSPSKGIETVIDAMPGIVRSCPNVIYVILGATHPNLVREQGEAYRESLKARVHELGLEDHVVFFDQFVDQIMLVDFLSMCDVYVTPYLNEAQMTSGTLAYSYGLGNAVVSTPYWHAVELLSEGRGVLVPFSDVPAMAGEITALLPTTCAGMPCGRALSWRADRWPGRKPRNAILPALKSCMRGPAPPLWCRSSSTIRGAGNRTFRTYTPDTFCRSATAPACCSTPATPCPTALMATASTTTRVPCCWRASLRIPIRKNCLERRPPILRPSFSMHGMLTPAGSGIS